MQLDIRAAFKVRWKYIDDVKVKRNEGVFPRSEENSLRNGEQLGANRTRGCVSDWGKERKRIEFRSRLERVVSRSRAVDRLQPINIATGVRKYQH